jgi:hypothetical protein
MRDNGMLVVNEEGLFQSDLTFDVEVQPERTLEEIELECKKRKWAYELNRKFQDSWAAKLPWAESVSSEDRLVTHVLCKICTKVSGKDKLLAPKFDSLCKHASRKKFTSPMPGVPKGTFYYAKDCQHAKNELLYVSRSGESVLDRVMQGMVHEGLKKVIQFVTVFYLLQEGKPMLEYESMKGFLQFLQVKNCPQKHWCDNTGWSMAEIVHNVVKAATADAVKAANFISISCDEVTSVDNQSWLSLHAYIIKEWSWIPILLSLERVVKGADAGNLTRVIIQALLTVGGLIGESLSSKLICFGADSVSVFQGARTGVTWQFKLDYAPHMQGIHCMAHQTNLVV